MKQSASQYKKAVEAIQSCSRLYKVRFDIWMGRDGDIKNAYGGPEGHPFVFWRIRAMGKRFQDEDFVECARRAVTFVYNAMKDQGK